MTCADSMAKTYGLYVALSIRWSSRFNASFTNRCNIGRTRSYETCEIRRSTTPGGLTTVIYGERQYQINSKVYRVYRGSRLLAEDSRHLLITWRSDKMTFSSRVYLPYKNNLAYHTSWITRVFADMAPYISIGGTMYRMFRKVHFAIPHLRLFSTY